MITDCHDTDEIFKQSKQRPLDLRPAQPQPTKEKSILFRPHNYQSSTVETLQENYRTLQSINFLSQ